MAMLIAEDLLLLLLDDESGKLTNATYLDSSLGGALLVAAGLAINRWSVGTLLADDGRIDNRLYLGAILAFQFVLAAAIQLPGEYVKSVRNSN